jgi:HlyD family secretion protein
MIVSLVIVKLAGTGARVSKGDIVIEFDPSEEEHTLQQNRLDLLQADQEIAKAKADAAVQSAQDQVALLKAKFDVRRAELDVSRNSLVSAIDAKKNLLALEEAQRRLAQLQQDIQSHTQSNQASVAVAEEKRRKAQLMMKQAQSNIDNMQGRAPIEGLVSVKENSHSSGGFYYPGMSRPDYREGDQVDPGSPVAEVLNVSQMEIQTKVNESDRANLKPGEPVEIRIEALPEKLLSGKVKTVAELASRGMFWSSSTTSKFDVSVQLSKSDGQLRPGLSAQAVILGGEERGARSRAGQALDGRRQDCP